MADELLGGGLDIEGWNFIKHDVAAKIAEMTDRSTVLRSTFALLVRSKFQTEGERKDIHDIILGAIEAKSAIDTPAIAKKVKMDLDALFGSPWQVVVGEAFAFSVDHDTDYLHYVFYGPIAVLAFKCEVNHLDEGRKKVAAPDPNLMVRKKVVNERI